MGDADRVVANFVVAGARECVLQVEGKSSPFHGVSSASTKVSDVNKKASEVNKTPTATALCLESFSPPPHGGAFELLFSAVRGSSRAVTKETHNKNW